MWVTGWLHVRWMLYGDFQGKGTYLLSVLECHHLWKPQGQGSSLKNPGSSMKKECWILQLRCIYKWKIQAVCINNWKIQVVCINNWKIQVVYAGDLLASSHLSAPNWMQWRAGGWGRTFKHLWNKNCKMFFRLIVYNCSLNWCNLCNKVHHTTYWIILNNYFLSV